MSVDSAQTAAAPAGVENYNLGGAIKPDSASAVGNKIEQDTPAPSTSATGGTGGEVKHYIRKDLANVQLAESTVPGAILTQLELDSSLIPESYQSDWQQWSIESLKIQMISTAAFGNATGAAIIGSVPDPQNAFSTDNATNLRLAMAVTHSRIVQAKNSTELHIHPGTHESSRTFKWIKKGGTPRLESFGRVFIACKQPSATGTVAQWTLSMTATLVFRDHTFNTDKQPAVSIQPSTYINFEKFKSFQATGDSATGLGFEVTNEQSPIGAIIRSYGNKGPLYGIAVFENNSNAQVIRRRTIPLTDFKTAADTEDKPYAVTLISDLNLGSYTPKEVTLIGEPSDWIVQGTIPAAVLNNVPLHLLESELTQTLEQL